MRFARMPVVVLVVLMAVLAVGRAAAADPGQVYWVVPGTPGSASQMTLPEVSQRLLGDSSRWPEILQLNEGRPQPGGGALAGDGKLMAGWALVLPEGARSGEIRLGPPPGPASAATGTTAQGPATDTGTSDGTVLPWVLGGIGVLVLGVLVVFATIAVRRRSRRVTTVAASAAVDSRDGRTVLDRALRQVTDLPDAPSVYAAVVGPDRVSLRLAPARPDAPPPWQARQQGAVWEAANWQLDGGPGGGIGLPLLASVGTIGGELTMVNLGRAPGLIAFVGDRAVAATSVAAAIDEIAADPAARGVPIVVVGTALPTRIAPGRIEYVADVAGVFAGPPGPRLVVVTGAVPSASALELARFAADNGDSAAVVVLGDVPNAAWRFAARPDGTLDVGVLGLSLDTKAGVR